MQMMAMMYAGQEQQRLTNTWVVQSMEAISASAGCAIEAPPASQEIVTLSPALVRMAQSAAQGAAAADPMATEMAAAEPAVSPEVSKVVTNAGGNASPSRSPGRGRARGGAAGTTAAAVKAAANSSTRATKKQPDRVGMPPAAEMVDGLEDGEDLIFEPYADLVDAGKDGQPSPHGTAEVLKCLYGNLFGNEKPAKAQTMEGGARERTPSETEGDALRVEEQLLDSAPPPQDF